LNQQIACLGTSPYPRSHALYGSNGTNFRVGAPVLTCSCSLFTLLSRPPYCTSTASYPTTSRPSSCDTRRKRRVPITVLPSLCLPFIFPFFYISRHLSTQSRYHAATVRSLLSTVYHSFFLYAYIFSLFNPCHRYPRDHHYCTYKTHTQQKGSTHVDKIALLLVEEGIAWSQKHGSKVGAV
jgi:hypothetical protein